MLFNIATLLQEPPGAARKIDVTGEYAEVASEGYRRAVAGDVHLLRTTRGILLRAKLRVEPEYECSRCLKQFITPVDLEIDELFAFSRDPVSLAVIELDPDEFHLEDEQYLDASEAVRQYEVAARPIRSLCRPDCAGLCPRCGRDLNEGPCECAADELHTARSRVRARVSLRGRRSLSSPRAYEHRRYQMGVPKRRTSQAKQGLRRSHHHAALPSIVRDPRTGQWKLSHGVSSRRPRPQGPPAGRPRGAPLLGLFPSAHPTTDRHHGCASR